MEDGYDPGYQLMSDQEIVKTIMLDREDSNLKPMHRHVLHLNVHWNGCSCKVIYRPSSSDAGQELAGSCCSAPSTSCKTNTNYLICTLKNHRKL